MKQQHSDDTDTRVPVVFIGATGRSGSTLLSRVLGNLPGVCSVGELCWLWTYGVKLNRPCGCGLPFDECPFWLGVGERAYGGWTNVDAERAIDLRRTLTDATVLPQLLARPTARTRRLIDEYTDLFGPLYAAARDESGARVVLDNSKQAAIALLVRRIAPVNLSVIHLVRRAHGVAYSWTKHVAREDNSGREMRRRGTVRTAARWSLDNVLFETVGRTGTPRMLVRYEDFVADPLPHTRAMATFMGLQLDPGRLPFVGPHEVSLAPDHSVWGNPMRMRQGPERLRADESWRSALEPGPRRTVTALSWPGLVRYGYLSRKDRSSGQLNPSSRK